MVFASFIKQAKFKFYHQNLHFFQTTYRQFTFYDGLSEYCPFFNTKWYSNHKYARSKLAISNGHYGLYYTMYNHDEKQKSPQLSINDQLLLQYLLKSSSLLLLLLSNYLINYYINFIPKLNLKFDLKINLSNYHVKVNQSVNLKRYFLTFCPRSKNLLPDEPLHENDPIKSEPIKIEKIEPNQVSNNHSEIPSNSNHVSENPVDLSQDDSFLLNQINLIENLYSQQQYLSIYPIYQSLKRNDLKINNIDTYNLILQSIAYRDFNNHHDLSIPELLEIHEIKLTDLLTVYQDLLINNVKPNLSTYNLIIENLLSSSSNLSNMALNSNGLSYHQTLLKCRNFAQIGLDVFNSIQNYADLNLLTIIPLIINNLINHPELINQEILAKIIKLNQFTQYQQALLDNTNYQASIDTIISLISLSKFFERYPQLFDNDSKKKYEFIVSIYDMYKQIHQTNKLNTTTEFEIYAPLIESLIYNNYTNLASKFLDDILIDYKNSITSITKPSKAQISQILSNYIISIANQSKEVDITNDISLHKAYNLLMKFNKIQYLPELSIELYNDLINKFVNSYYKLSNDKSKLSISDSNKLNPIFNQQVSFLEKAWSLYDHLAIRNDYQDTKSSIKNSCRESLLSLSIELGDHDHVFQLIKEILISKHLIFDIQVLKKLLSYLYNGVVSQSTFNYQYYGLIWNLVDSQLVYYKSDNSSNFISEIIHYLIIAPNPALIKANCQQLMNSTFIENVIDNFNFQKDNLYGISIISRFLMQYTGDNPDMINRIVNFQARLANKFEDTENHYFELNKELLDLKLMLKSYFSTLIENNQGKIIYNTEILHACKNYDLAVPENVIIDPKSLEFKHEVDLTYLLNIEYKSGSSEFVSLFNNNMNFNKATWEIIINHNFIHDYVLDLKFRIGEFIRRLFDAKFDMKSKISLLETLVKFEYETINISIIKFLQKNPSVLIHYPTKSIIELIEIVENSQNKHLKLLLYKDCGAFFSNLYEINKNLSWVAKYFTFLSNENQPQIIVNLINQHGIFDGIKGNMRILGDKFKIMTNYLWGLAMTNDPQFIKVFKDNFLANEHNKDYLSSRPIVEILLKYYSSRDDKMSIDLILTKFTPFYGKSKKINEGLLYASFLKGINEADYKCPFPIKKAETIEELSTRLVSSNFEEMKQIIDINRFMIQNETEAVVSTILRLLIDASKSQITNKKLLGEKFTMLIKAFKLMSVKELSVMNLSGIIKFLTMTDCKEILNIIIVKLINNNQFTNVLNFYFMETKFKTETEKYQILNLLFNASNYVNDKINAFKITAYSQANNIHLKLD